MLKPKVCHLQTSNLAGGWSMRYQLLWPAMPCEVGSIHVAGNTVTAAPAMATQLIEYRDSNLSVTYYIASNLNESR